LFHTNVYANILDSQPQFGECLLTSPPLSPSPSKERGKRFIERGLHGVPHKIEDFVG